jgi:hypothetical protein
MAYWGGTCAAPIGHFAFGIAVEKQTIEQEKT